MQSSVPVRSRAPAGNTATGWLKVLALVFMFIDHAGKVLFNNMQEMRILGRIAFPLYVWCMIVGFYYTRSVWKYMLRILITGLISQPLYVVALNHRWTEPNIFLTLLLGLCALWGIREKWFGSQIWAPAAAIMLATLLNANYGWQGVLLFILLYAVQDTRPGIAAVMVAYFMFWGASYSLTKSFFGIRISLGELPLFISRPLSPFLRMEAYALLSLPLILIPFKHDLRIPKWLGYALYPAHLVLLIILKAIMGV